MTRAALALAQAPLFTVAQLLKPMNPIQQLFDQQGGSCAACEVHMERAYARLEPTTRRVLALVCKACSTSKKQYTAPAVPDLLAVRLTPCSVRTGLEPVTQAAVAALHGRDWWFFQNPAQVLWTGQGGACAVTGHAASMRDGSLVVDADPETDLLLGIFCLQCKALEGKGNRKTEAAWRRYRRDPLGLALPPTRGVTRKFLRGLQ